MEREALLKELGFVVQYRRKDQDQSFDPWHTMAAFDVEGPAERYRDKQISEVWEYRMISLPSAE